MNKANNIQDYKKKYESCFIQLVYFDQKDVIVTSGKEQFEVFFDENGEEIVE